MTHEAMALQPNGFRFRFIPRKVPAGKLADWLDLHSRQTTTDTPNKEFTGVSVL